MLRRFDGENAYPPAVVGHLRRGAAGSLEDTPPPGDSRLARATATVIGSRREAMAGALREAASRGYHVLWLDEAVVGESRTAAAAHLRTALARADGVGRPVCIVSGGETTVHVVGCGTGGRNQEFALAIAADVSRLTAPGAVASVGTDGIDGPTDAAGALVDSTTLERAKAAGMSPDAFLADNNAYAFFARLGDLIHTGPTGTNVGDLQVILFS